MAQTRLQRWYDEVWNNANEDSIDALMDERAVIHGLQTELAHSGPLAFKPFYRTFRESFPSVTITAEPIITTDEAEAAHCVVEAMTRDGRRISFTGLSVAKFRDGKLVEAWNAFDFDSMNKQLAPSVTSELEQPR
jgi:predicted ester cyclase